MGSGGADYTAFLSYSHRDAAAAKRLHRRLEAYRIPRRLVGSEGARGPVPARLAPIFRDREELPAAGDLTQEVRAALAASGALVVVCSPHSAASPWVGREITAFRELHPDRPILAAILDGEPGECFPPDLTGGPGGARIEPLAADLRAQGDGERLGLLKLVAGLAGVPLDALVQRDAQRRIRRVTAVTAAALAAMLVMAVLTVFAVQARTEAQRQRAEAEGLVEFMLTDLRDRLHAVGRLDALGAVNARALAYYGGERELDGLSEESLGRRARILHAIGDDALSAHDLRSARAAFEEAAAHTAELTDRGPDDSARLLEHFKSLTGLGRIHEEQNGWADAQLNYAAAAALSDRLVTSSPRNPDHLTRAAAAALNLGNIRFRGMKDYARAEGYYSKAVGLFDRAARARPDDPHILLSEANALGWLADSFFMREMWTQSLTARLRQHAIVETLHRQNPTNADVMYRLAASERGVAHSLLKAGGANAQRHLARAHELAVRLTCLDGANGEWRDLRSKLERDFARQQFGSRAGQKSAGYHSPESGCRRALTDQA